MATIHPFRVLRPRPDQAERVASVPYDVVNRDEARALAAGNSISFLHVTKPEIDLPDSIDPHDERVYASGAESLTRLRDDGILIHDDEATLYVYELRMGEHRQVGVVFCASIEEYDRNEVRKHEHTRPDKENDRVQHMQAVGAQTGTVFLAHRDSTRLDRLLETITQRAPRVELTASDDVQHRAWVISEAAELDEVVEAFDELGPVYIADGHHRSAAASRVAEARRESGDGAEAASQKLLAVSFPESQVQILPYNRVVKDLGEHSAESFLEALRSKAELSEGKPTASERGRFGVYIAGRWYTLKLPVPGKEDVVDSLDVSILQSQILEPLLGIGDPRLDERIEFVGGIRGDAALERRVDATQGVAFSLHATALADLFRVADAGMVMPPKSTWFEPKLRDGLFVHLI